jgi:predicted transcriptional regulator
MLKSERAVLDVLFPEVRAKLLRLLFTTPPRQHYVRELTNMSGLALHTVQDELRKLSAIGLLTSWSNGYHRFYRANRDHAMYPQLLRIVHLSEALPHAKHSALHRPASQRTSSKQNRPKPRLLPADRPPGWNLFTPRTKTRRL